MSYKIYYGNGITYAGDPYNAPAFDVQVIVQDSADHGRILTCRLDYYVFQPEINAWLGVDLFGLWDYLQQPGPRKVIFGRTLPSRKFNELYKIAYHDPDFSAKTGHAYGEQVISND